MPLRTCIGCRLTDEQDRLVRLVADRAGRIRIDSPRHGLSGRGAYVHREKKCFDELVRRGALGRSLKRNVETVVADELWARLHERS